MSTLYDVQRIVREREQSRGKWGMRGSLRPGIAGFVSETRAQAIRTIRCKHWPVATDKVWGTLTATCTSCHGILWGGEDGNLLQPLTR